MNSAPVWCDDCLRDSAAFFVQGDVCIGWLYYESKEMISDSENFL